MLPLPRRSIAIVGLLLAALVGRAGAAPIDSDLGDARRGGGCSTTALQPSILDMLVLINPEWAPIVGGQTVDSDPVPISGIVEKLHGETGGDFPSTHALSDVVMDIRADPEHEDKVATGNDEEGVIAFEWEVGKYPDWAWPGFGDRIYGLGRHIFDCGHPAPRPGRCSLSTTKECVLDSDCRPPVCSPCGATETCEGPHFGYSSELHPPHATAVIRQGRGAPLSKRPAARPRPATIADVWVSPDGGGAGDRCVLTHHASSLDQLAVECWPLTEPVAQITAQDFAFALPLPPKPARGGKPRWRVLGPPASSDPTEPYGDTPARLRVRKRRDGEGAYLDVTVRMTGKVRKMLPTGFAGRIVAGWSKDKTAMRHVRVTVSALLVTNDLERAAPLVPKGCSMSGVPCETDGDCPAGESCWGVGPVRGWRGQVAVNGEWRRFSGPELDDVADGATVPQAIPIDQYLAADGSLRIQADAFARECIHATYGHSLAEELERLGLVKGLTCLGLDDSHEAGEIDVTYPGPDFGAGPSGSQAYETQSVGGEGGACSLTNAMLCVVDADCPGGESCTITGGAFRLRYTIERLS